MLVDDNPDDNFFHERVINKHNKANVVVIKRSGFDALQHLKDKWAEPNEHPDLIFLDINMPRMNGWEFLEEYKKLDKEMKAQIVVVMLTTSDNPDDKRKAISMGVAAHFKTKPLTKEMLDEVIEKNFP